MMAVRQLRARSSVRVLVTADGELVEDFRTRATGHDR